MSNDYRYPRATGAAKASIGTAIAGLEALLYVADGELSSFVKRSLEQTAERLRADLARIEGITGRKAA